MPYQKKARKTGDLREEPIFAAILAHRERGPPIGVVAQNLAGLGDSAQLSGQFEQTHFVLDDRVSRPSWPRCGEGGSPSHRGRDARDTSCVLGGGLRGRRASCCVLRRAYCVAPHAERRTLTAGWATKAARHPGHAWHEFDSSCLCPMAQAFSKS